MLSFCNNRDMRFISGDVILDNVLSDIETMSFPYIRMSLKKHALFCHFSDHNHFAKASLYYEKIFPKIQKPSSAPEDYLKYSSYKKPCPIIIPG